MFTAPTAAINSDLDLYDFLTNDILDEDIGEGMGARLLSQAKNAIELELKLQILIDEDATQTRAAGDTYLTMKSLPDNFRSMLELYVGSILPPFRQIPFKDRLRYGLSNWRYYVDHKNAQFAICGNAGAAATIHQIYLIKTDDFTESSLQSDSAATCVWPKEHWPAIAWKAAEMISSGTDVGADDLSFRMSAEQKRQAEDAIARLRDWDQELKLAAQDGRAGMEEDIDYPDIEDTLPYL